MAAYILARGRAWISVKPLSCMWNFLEKCFVS
jgi:hypothetical protein